MITRLDEIKTEDEFRNNMIQLLTINGFKVETIVEGAGSDGGRDIEATSFEYDTATRFNECVKWWVELKFRSQNNGKKINLGMQDLNDISSKIIRAADNCDKFLLITSGKLSVDLYESLIAVSKSHRILLRIWDRDKINSIMESISENSYRGNILIADRNKETNAIINIIKSRQKNVVQITGKRGIGKSLVAKFIAQHLNYIDGYGYGYIDCRSSEQIGSQIKQIAESLSNQNHYSEFTDTITLNKSENERVLLLCRHIENQKSIIIFDNFECVLDESRKISSPQLENIVNYVLEHKINESVIIITSQIAINNIYSSQSAYHNFELTGWDINYVIESYIKNLRNISEQMKDFSLEKKKHILMPVDGNPFALKILNQLCFKHNIENIMKRLEGIEDIAIYLLEQLTDDLTKDQVSALEKLSQFNRNITINEALNFVCDKATIDSLILRELVELSSDELILHPLTAKQFSLDDNYPQKINIVNCIINKIENYLEHCNIDDNYPHDLMRQVLNMELSINNYDKSAEVLIKIGTRILSCGDIYYLNSIISNLDREKISQRNNIRLMKLEAHIASYSDQLDEAQKVYESMLKKSIIIGDPWSESAALNGIGSMARYVYDFKTAISNYTKSAKIRLNNGLEKELSNSYHNIGATYIISKDYGEAICFLEKACKIREKYNDKFRLSASLLYLGESYTMNADYIKAEEKLLICNEIKKAMNDVVGIVWSVCSLAKLYILSDNKAKFNDLHHILIDAEKTAYKLKLSRHLVLIRIYLGVLELYNENFTEAIGFFNNSLEICQEFRKDLFNDDIKELTLIALNFDLNKIDNNVIKEIIRRHKI